MTRPATLAEAAAVALLWLAAIVAGVALVSYEAPRPAIIAR